MIDNIIHFILHKFIILGILVPIVLVLKFLLYRKLQNGTEKFHDFFYYTYANIATTHNRERKNDKQLQNSLFFILLFLLVMQFVLSIPMLLNS